jgi:molecular chaperone DnaK (HSP70)
MPYVLGIDIGSHRTAAAIAHLRGEEAEVVRLGGRSATVPTALRVTPDGPVPTREDDPDTVRGFFRRVGDDVPVHVAGQAYRPQTLAATLVRWVVDEVTDREGEPPERVIVAHPAGWGPYRTELLHETLWRAGLDRVTLLPEPVAAAEGYASAQPVAVGGNLAVYGLGAAHCGCAVVRRTAEAEFEVLAAAETGEPIGGADLDDALTDRVRAELGEPFTELPAGDAALRMAMSWLRRQCVVAKEELSGAEEATVRVALPQARRDVRVTRDEFEGAVRPMLDVTVELLLDTVATAGLSPAELEAVLLVGGSVRVPLVGRLVAASTPGRVAIEADPELSVAKGAALAGRSIVVPTAPTSGYPAPLSVPPEEPERESEQPPPRPPVRLTPLDPPQCRFRRSGGVLSELSPAARAAVMLLAVLVVAVSVLLAVVTFGKPFQLGQLGM